MNDHNFTWILSFDDRLFCPLPPLTCMSPANKLSQANTDSELALLFTKSPLIRVTQSASQR